MYSRRFDHDCEVCQYHGSGGAAPNYEHVDWYYHPDPRTGGSIIGRYGDEGHEYWSMHLDCIARFHDHEEGVCRAAQIVAQEYMHNLPNWEVI